jgi:hypothetical protein
MARVEVCGRGHSCGVDFGWCSDFGSECPPRAWWVWVEVVGGLVRLSLFAFLFGRFSSGTEGGVRMR